MGTLGIITALGDRFPVLVGSYDLCAIEMYCTCIKLDL